MYTPCSAISSASIGEWTGEYGIAGGAPGTSASLESDGVWTVVVLTNFDPPLAPRLGQAIFRALSRQ
jgi:hypothetical protein